MPRHDAAVDVRVGGDERVDLRGILDEHQEIAKEIEAKIYAALGIGQDLVAPIERDTDIPVPPLPAARSRWPTPSGS